MNAEQKSPAHPRRKRLFALLLLILLVAWFSWREYGLRKALPVTNAGITEMPMKPLSADPSLEAALFFEVSTPQQHRPGNEEIFGDPILDTDWLIQPEDALFDEQPRPPRRLPRAALHRQPTSAARIG